jgi:sulfatase modifying factor 1
LRELSSISTKGRQESGESIMHRWLLAVALIVFLAYPALAEPPLPHLPFDARRAAALRQEWARAFQLEPTFTNSIGMKLVLIPGGRFDMGPNGSKYRVTLAKSYYLGATEVTMGQYRRFKVGHKVEGAATAFNADNVPAAMVSWDEARAFCDWLSRQPAEKAAGRVYALPTEAQWEWAARAGTTTSRYFGDTDKGQKDYSWFNVTYTPNPKHEEKGRGRQPVAKLQPNAWGLYDMLGNVWEWCADRHRDETTGERRDPVMRGGSWRSGAFHCTAVAHDPGAPGQRGDNIGFRVACRIVRAR